MSEPQTAPRIPVTVLSGFLGAGKTTLLQHVLTHARGPRVAVIVNDMSDVNIDATLLRDRGVEVARREAAMVEMSNGCICCTLRGDLIDEVRRLAAARRFDAILIESTGISEPMPVAATFEFRDEHGFSLSDVARLDTMVTVVDAGSLLADYGSTDFLRDRGESLGDDDDRTLVDLLTDQIEFADVIVINGCDRADEAQRRQVHAVCRALNRDAEIIETAFGCVDPAKILNTGRFDFERAHQAPGWLKELLGEHTPETEEYGIRSFTYRARRPFHPARFYALLADHGAWGPVLRAKGYFWLASRPDFAGELAKAGGALSHQAAGLWWASQPEHERPTDADWWRHSVAKVWQEPWGDRRQELVFIGLDLDDAPLRAALDACLLTDDEYAAGPDAWARLPDPFPLWRRAASAA